MGPSADKKNDVAHADIGFVCALPIEFAPFLDRCEKQRKYKGGGFVFRGARYGDIKVAVAESGVGFARARRATQALVDAHTPRWIISAGFSGALQPEMQVGNIVMANAIADVHGHELSVDLKMQADPDHGLYVGRIISADDVVRTVAEKRLLANTFDGVAVDLESLAVAQVCKETGTKFLAVRVISDDMSADLPGEILSVLGATGTMRAGAALGALWKRPGSFKDLWKLRESANRAAERLATFLDSVVAQLYEADH